MDQTTLRVASPGQDGDLANGVSIMATSRSVVPLTTLSMGVLALLLLIGSAPNSSHVPVVQSEPPISHGKTHSLRVSPAEAAEPVQSPADRIRDAFDQFPGPRRSLIRPRNNFDDVISC
jgi:hypothetical protein